MTTVVIDPGHGGTTVAGGSSPNHASGPNGLLEKDVTLDLARRVSSLLASKATVILTRTGDENHSLTERARIARDANADIFVSLHLNGWTDPRVDGSEAWIAAHAAAPSRQLARRLLDQILTVTHARDLGVQEQDLGVLVPQRHAANTAAALLEIAFLTNPDEANRLNRDDYKQALAQAIATALITQLPAANGAIAQSLTTTDQTDAIAIVNTFRAETTAGAFTPRRDDVADRAIALINDPSLVDQGSLNLCGPAAVHRLWIERDPKAFARYVTSLYDTGSASFGTKTISPGGDLRGKDYDGVAVPAMRTAGGVCPSADWVAMSSLRDASNTFLDFEGMPSEDVSAMSTPAEVADWLRATGMYSDVSDEGNWVVTKGTEHAEGLTPGQGVDVVMLINAHILSSSAAKGHKKSDEFILSAFPNHFVVLRSPVTEPTADEVEFDCWTWGADVHVRLPKTVFTANYYGAVIARTSSPSTGSLGLTTTALQAPPARIDGIDCNAPDALPSWADLRSDGIQYLIHKASEHDTYKDPQYIVRHIDARAANFIFGSYHFFRANADATAQANNFIDVVQRLLPGDLPPSFDFEEGGKGPDGLKASGITGAGWLAPITAFLDRVETALGRTPMIYTSWQVWHDYPQDHPDLAAIGEYPLWVKYWHLPVSTRYAKRLTRTPGPALPTAWSDWAIWQYTGDVTPTEYTNLHAVNPKMDGDVTNGGIHVLRGLAGLGRPGTPQYLGSELGFVAHADETGTIQLIAARSGGIEHRSLTDDVAERPLAAGDVAMCSLGNERFIAFRGRSEGHLYEIDGTTLTDLTATIVNAGTGDDPTYLRPASDPVYITIGLNDRALVYRGGSDHQYLLQTKDGAWQLPALDVTANAQIDAATGDAALYLDGDSNVHVVARAGYDGNLIDAWHSGIDWNHLDLTARSGAPAATYQPATYTGTDGIERVVFRALRGEIHQIDTHSSQDDNISRLAGGAPTCAGSPAVFIIDGLAHVVYRRLDGTLHEIFQDGAAWQHRDLPCSTRAAADPVVFTDTGPTVPEPSFVPAAYVVYRDRDGALQQAMFKAGAWSCKWL